MPITKTRMSYSLEEVFGQVKPDQREPELERTHGLPSDPLWTSSINQFSIGLRNDRESTLSSMVARKTADALASHTLRLHDFLDFVLMNQARFFDFISRIIDRIVGVIESRVVPSSVQTQVHLDLGSMLDNMLKGLNKKPTNGLTPPESSKNGVSDGRKKPAKIDGKQS